MKSRIKTNMRKEPKIAKHINKQKAQKRSKLKVVDKAFQEAQKKYKNFDQLDGSHPWQEQVPEGYIGYKVYRVEDAQVAYFNYDLAKEMGLIPKNHPNKLNEFLEEKILDAFALRIVNEYDLENETEALNKQHKENIFMATRYLQLQHPNKQGKTSGDGRSIWNGSVNAKGREWDVSSRGTGVTRLAPGVVEAGKFLESGGEDFGYACGMAEVDELYATAIMSEVFHNQGIPTERSLCIIETTDKLGIGVRAGQNLLRPAHLFAFLKQSNVSALDRALQYHVDRQIQNKRFKDNGSKSKNYKYLLDQIINDYSKFAALLESEYIFAWFDWDGDNMLMDIGILDYGSIRQFGIRHDEYRYDDVTRYSTNLNEQKQKTRKIVQTFCQLFDFLSTGQKKPIAHFSENKQMKKFDLIFERELELLFLEKIGLTRSQSEDIFKSSKKELSSCFEAYAVIEKAKAKNKKEEVFDGVNRQPLYNPRKLLRILADPNQNFELEEIFQNILAEDVDRSSVFSSSRKKQLVHFIETYNDLILVANGKRDLHKKQHKNCNLVNSPERLTGNSVTYIVNEILEARDKKLKGEELQNFIDLFIYNTSKPYNKSLKPPKESRVAKSTVKSMLKIVNEFSEDI
ncbi:MAG: hypothetical protein AB8E15_10165 [Bdellovibrionales bacterium]